MCHLYFFFFYCLENCFISRFLYLSGIHLDVRLEASLVFQFYEPGFSEQRTYHQLHPSVGRIWNIFCYRRHNSSCIQKSFRPIDPHCHSIYHIKGKLQLFLATDIGSSSPLLRIPLNSSILWAHFSSICFAYCFLFWVWKINIHFLAKILAFCRPTFKFVFWLLIIRIS